jgi:hypothetical protein
MTTTADGGVGLVVGLSSSAGSGSGRRRLKSWREKWELSLLRLIVVRTLRESNSETHFIFSNYLTPKNKKFIKKRNILMDIFLVSHDRLRSTTFKKGSGYGA